MKRWQRRFFQVSGHYLRYFDVSGRLNPGACLWQKKEKSASGDVRGLIDLMHIKELKGESREIVMVALDGVLVHVSLVAGLSCAQFG